MNKIFKTTLYIIMCIVALVGIIGCTHERTYRIGVSQCSDDDWRRKMNEEINREAMLHDDVEVEIRSADDSSKKQIEDIQYFVDNDFDILIISPNEAITLTPVIDEVYRSGMPVIIFDRSIDSDSYTARIGADDDALGRAAAHYALSILGDSPRALEIRGLPGSTPAAGRHRGFNNEFTDEGGIVAADAPANWNEPDAFAVTDSLLSIYDNISLIFCHNDRMAIGAAHAADSMGRSGIKIIGIDAAPEIGVQAVADGVIDATLLYPTEGHRLIRTALAILKGEPYNRETILPMASVVDDSNADILLLQNENLKDETEKMRVLKAKVDDYWEQHTTQTLLFYACIAIIALLFILVFLILRAYWQHRRHQEALIEQNRILEEQRDIERSLNIQLKEATQSKLMFFTNVSHDLRTPLTLISEPVARLAAADNLTDSQHALMRIADKNVRILRRLINQILDFRKYENGKMQLNLTEIDLGRAVADWLESFAALARKRRIRLTSDIQAYGTVIAVDIEKLERVMFNLISNAFKYTAPGGDIKVSCSVGPESAIITVTDTGEGISERDLGNIFDRFYQVERVHPNGSGIGLSLSKAFVELHGGTIEVESTLRKGSEFRVILPVRHVADTASEAPSTITSADVEAELDISEDTHTFDEDKPLILVIDDNKDIQRLISELLQPDYNIITAANGSEGIRKAVKYVPDLIICDVMMPVMDGLECCRRLKAEVTTSHIPTLMLTACSMDEQRVQGYESGADGYLSKPFSSAVLTARCKSLIDNRRRIKDLWHKANESPISATDTFTARAATPDSDIDSDFYRRFLNVFEKEMSNADISVDDLAARMGLQRTQFYRKIKSLTNFSPVELIRNLRLRHALNLLKTTDRSISEIAYDSGFSTPAYFTRCYREAYGETPSETRTRLGVGS